MPVRVLFPFVGDSVGGSHISTTVLIKHLDHERYEPAVVLHEEGPLVPYLEAQGIDYEIVRLPALAGQVPSVARILGAQLRSLPAMRRAINRAGAAIVHTNDLRMHLSWSFGARATGRRWFWHQRMLLSGAATWSLLGLVASQTACISKAVQESLPAGHRDKAHVLYNPVQPQPTRGAATDLRSTLGIPSTALLVGFVGNMVSQKRPLCFVEAAAEIAREFEGDVRFVLIGDDRGGLMERAKALVADLEIGQRTHFLGHRSPVEPLIAQFDLLIAPGVGDGFGRTLAEAMFVGTPVLAADSGGHSEIVSDGLNGWLSPPDDVAALSRKAQSILRDRDLRSKVAGTAREMAIVNFDARHHAMKVMTLYDRMI